MKSKYLYTLFVAYTGMAMLLQTVMVFANTSDSANEIKKAMDLYTKAAPMDMHSEQRKSLLSQAESILQDVIKRNPKSLDAHRKLMGVYLLQQYYSKGISVMQDAITLSPEDPKLFISLAFLYEHSGALEQSEAMLDHALELDPKNKTALDYKVHILSKKKNSNIEDMHPDKDMMGAFHGKVKTEHNSDKIPHSAGFKGD